MKKTSSHLLCMVVTGAIMLSLTKSDMDRKQCKINLLLNEETVMSETTMAEMQWLTTTTTTTTAEFMTTLTTVKLTTTSTAKLTTATTATTTAKVVTTTEGTTTNVETAETTTAYEWEGVKLSPMSGVVAADETPSGYRETYYNLPMWGCLDLMGLPYDGMDTRADGVKTYGGYVMVASPDLDCYPKGSLIPTTLGMGIVVDFCPEGNLDIAVEW